MTEGRRERVDQLFAAALDLEPGARERFLEAECGDAEIRREVAALLKSSEDADPFFAALADRIGAPRGGLGDVASAEGRQLGPYRLVREVGRGGMGAVYLAERIDGQFEQRVAIKLLPIGLSTDAARRRFLTERRFLARLEHPGIARLLDGGVAEDDTPFFVMEYVEGEPIDRYCDRSRLGIAARLALFRQVCCAVRYAHRNLLVHRDLKPNNILVSAPASGEAAGTVKLLDFGIAKFLGAETAGEPTELTRLGGSPLTPTYASPEQLKGEAVTTASDVYALGALLYRLLCGRSPHPLKGCTPAAAEHIVCERNPPPPSAAVRREPNGDETADDGSPATARTLAAARGTGPERLARRLRGDLDTIVLKALRKEPERRYASAGDLADDIERYLTGRPVAARPDTHGYRLRKFVGRNRAVVVAATLLIATGLAALFLHTERLEAERDAARVEAAKAEAVRDFLIGTFDLADLGATGGLEVTAREILDNAEIAIRANRTGHPEVRAEMLGALASVYAKLAVYVRAGELAEETLELLRGLGVRDSPVMVDMLRIAGEERARGASTEAKAFYDAAREMAERLWGADDPRLAAVLRAQGNRRAYSSGSREEALAHVDRAVSILRAAPGDVRAELAEALLVRAYGTTPEEAVPIMTEALELRRAVFGEESRQVATVMSDLALALETADSPAADTLIRRAVELHRAVAGELHPGTLTLRNNMAGILRDRGDFAEAEREYREVLALYREHFRGEDDKIGFAAYGLGVVLTETARPGEAVPLLREVAEIYPVTDGRGRTARGILVRALELQGRDAEAEAVRLTLR